MIDPRKRQALSKSKVDGQTVGTHSKSPGRSLSRPPGIAPLDTVLPEDMRLARTKTSLGLMQALVFKGGDEKR